MQQNGTVLDFTTFSKQRVSSEKGCALMDFKLIYIHIYSVILFVFKSAPWLFKYTPNMRQNFTWRIVRDEYYITWTCVLILLFKHISCMINTLPSQHHTNCIETSILLRLEKMFSKFRSNAPPYCCKKGNTFYIF